jgi:hydroxymethylglutaryl-CoA reductase
MSEKTISGFSKLSKRGKIKWIVENFFKDPENVMRELKSYWLDNEEQQKIIDGFSENTISNYYLPYGVAPNFVINGKTYCVPMVTEESSVVAAAAKSAKYWMSRGGFHAEIIGTVKLGQIHFLWEGDHDKLKSKLPEISKQLIELTAPLTKSMEGRGGGIRKIELKDFSASMDNYFQLMIHFDTCDSMGANFINSVLEEIARTFPDCVENHPDFVGIEKDVDIIMSILTNYTPECLVRSWVECDIKDLGTFHGGMDARTFAERFYQAVYIAAIDPYRATTHNKGIFNGIDAVVIATANDFRAIEACGHAYAAKDGQYKGLSHCSVENGMFRFWIDIPLAVGSVGGLTSLHPVARRSLELLDHPGGEDLMKIIASTGLAQNFAAIHSLVTTGIQKGHMKMHMINMLNRIQATDLEIKLAHEYFENHIISHQAVADFMKNLRAAKNVSGDLFLKNSHL